MKKTINEWIDAFNRGEWDSRELEKQLEAGWYDWYCRDSSLQKKTEKLGRNLVLINKSKKFDSNKCYVWFKNNCPMDGNLYDDFRIADIETGDTVFCIVPKSGHRSMNGIGSVWGKENDFKIALFTGAWSEIKKWFYQED